MVIILISRRNIEKRVEVNAIVYGGKMVLLIHPEACSREEERENKARTGSVHGLVAGQAVLSAAAEAAA